MCAEDVAGEVNQRALWKIMQGWEVGALAEGSQSSPGRLGAHLPGSPAPSDFHS